MDRVQRTQWLLFYYMFMLKLTFIVKTKKINIHAKLKTDCVFNILDMDIMCNNVNILIFISNIYIYIYIYIYIIIYIYIYIYIYTYIYIYIYIYQSHSIE